MKDIWYFNYLLLSTIEPEGGGGKHIDLLSPPPFYILEMYVKYDFKIVLICSEFSMTYICSINEQSSFHIKPMGHPHSIWKEYLRIWKCDNTCTHSYSLITSSLPQWLFVHVVLQNMYEEVVLIVASHTWLSMNNKSKRISLPDNIFSYNNVMHATLFKQNCHI